MQQMITVWDVTYERTTFTTDNFEIVVDTLKESQEGDEYSIIKKEMSETDFQNLPEFTGF